MANAIVAVGGKLQVDIASVFTDVVEIVSIQGPDIEVGTIDVTHLQSPNQFKEFIAGLGDGGTLVCEGNFTPAQYNTLYGFLRVTKPWRVILSNGSRFDANGHITMLGNGMPLEEEVHMPVSIKLTGKPTFTQ